MTTTLNARFDGKVFVPEGVVHVPAGSLVRLDVTVPALRGATAEQLRELLGRHDVDADAMRELERRVEEDCEGIDNDAW